MEPKIIREKISKEELSTILGENFSTMVKVDVDVRRHILAVGGEWHSEGDELLNQDGSVREDVWGVNFYPHNDADERIEYVSLINIKPSSNHRSMEIRDGELQKKIRSVIEDLLLSNSESLNVHR